MTKSFPDAESTIVAAASPPGRSLRGLVRLSGVDAWHCCAPLAGRPDPPRPHHFVPAELRLPDLLAPVPVSLAWMPAPRSYTREPLLEIHTFGSPLLLSALCDALVQQGARLAAPGEFTRRAFLRGRLDLTQAEAVLEVIHAQDEAEHRQALEHLHGSLHQHLQASRQALIQLGADCEAALDFSDQDLEEVAPARVAEELRRIQADLQDLLSASQESRPAAGGVRALLAGRPNVGKSSLLNRLAGRPAALVSAHPGTTRDPVECALDLRGIEFRLRDAAGLREPRDPLEAASIARARQGLSSSDLILFVLNRSEPLSPEDLALAAELEVSRTLLVLNKCDLPPRLHLEPLPAPLRALLPVVVSARTGEGLEALQAALVEAVESGKAGASAPAFLISLRQRNCLQRASRSLARGMEAAEAGAGLELLALDLREALDALGEVVGEVVTEDLLDVIFSRFCIGK